VFGVGTKQGSLWISGVVGTMPVSSPQSEIKRRSRRMSPVPEAAPRTTSHFVYPIRACSAVLSHTDHVIFCKIGSFRVRIHSTSPGWQDVLLIVHRTGSCCSILLVTSTITNPVIDSGAWSLSIVGCQWLLKADQPPCLLDQTPVASTDDCGE